MKRLNDSNDVLAFGQYLAADHIKKSGVLRRLAEGLSDEPNAVAALLPQEQFIAWLQFEKSENVSAEKLAAVLEAATVLEDPDTVDAAARMLALIVRGSFRRDLPGTPLERLRAMPNSEPSRTLADGHSASPSDFPVSGTSDGTTRSASAGAGGSGGMISIHLSGTFHGSYGPSIAGSGAGSNSTPIADTQRLLRARAAGSSSGSAVPGFSTSPSRAFEAGFLVPTTHHSDRVSSPPPPPSPFLPSSPTNSTAGDAPGAPNSAPSSPPPPTSDRPSAAASPGPSNAPPAEAGPQHAFPPRSIIASLSALSPEPLQATLRHLHLGIVLHLPPRFRTAALQSRAATKPDAGPDKPLTALDLTGTLAMASPCGRPSAVHPVIATFAQVLPSSLPALQHLSLAENNLRPSDAAALSTAVSALPSLASLDLSNNPDLTAAAVAELVCSCTNLKAGLTRLCLISCSRANPAALAGALNFLQSLAILSFGPAPPRMGDAPMLSPLADPLSRMTSLESLHLSGFGAATLALIPHLPFETLTTLDVASDEDIVAPMHAALADEAPRMQRMRQLLLLGWSCTTTDTATIDRFMLAISALPRLEALSLSGAPPHNPDLTPITRLTTLTSVKFKNLSRHLVVPLMCHLPLLHTYSCVKCHTPPPQVYPTFERSGASIFHAMRTVELEDCDMNDSARTVTFKHLRGLSHLHALRITFPLGGNLSYFPRLSEMQIFLPMLSGLTRLELTCCHRFMPDCPDAVLDFSAQTALRLLRVTASDRSASPEPQVFKTSAFRGLGTLTALRLLDFSNTALADLPSFVAELAPLTDLTHLCLVNTAPPAAAQAASWDGAAVGAGVAAALAPLLALEHFAMCFVPLGDAGAAMLAPALGRLHRLQHLGLLKTGISDVGAAALWSHLRALPLDKKVFINSAVTQPNIEDGTDSLASGSIAVAQGHPGFPYHVI